MLSLHQTNGKIGETKTKASELPSISASVGGVGVGGGWAQIHWRLCLRIESFHEKWLLPLTGSMKPSDCNAAK